MAPLIAWQNTSARSRKFQPRMQILPCLSCEAAGALGQQPLRCPWSRAYRLSVLPEGSGASLHLPVQPCCQTEPGRSVLRAPRLGHSLVGELELTHSLRCL